ncbi:DUF2523 family protein [Burkholderia multivorans]|uniref:DUF2523 family protein n=1 Tax=Burkholderia multivorans TaxID=87883 RepID=UPI00345E6234
MKFAFRSIIAKFFIMFILYFVVQAFVSALQSAGILPSASNVAGITSNIPPIVSYFLNMFYVYQGISLCISAYASRFIIRRIPFLN